MPIKGISDRRRLIRVGKLHLGVKKRSAKGAEYPSAVDYFVCKEDASTSAEADAAFKEVYGDEPKELDIVFPVDDELLFADQNYKMYGRAWGLLCRGNGEEALAKWDVSGDGPRPECEEYSPGRSVQENYKRDMTFPLQGTWATSKTTSWVYRKIPCLGPQCPMQASEKPLCKAVMNLQFMLPRVRGVGVWQIDTGSWNSIHAVLDSIETVKAITGGRVRGVTLALSLVPKEVTPANQAGGVVAEGSGGDIKTKTVHVLHVALPGITLPEMLAETAKLPERALLPPPPAVDDEEAPGDLFPAAVTVDEETGEVLEGKAEEVGKGFEETLAAQDPAPESPQPQPAEPGPPSAPEAVEPPIMTQGDLLNRCLLEFKVDRVGVLKIVGVADMKEITDFANAYKAVKAAAKE